MRIFRKDNIKRVIVLNIVVLFIFVSLTILFTNYQYNQYVYNMNISIVNMLKNIKDTYPDVKQEQIVDALNAINETDFNNELLAKYGIDINTMPIIASLDTIKQFSIIQNISIFAIFVILIFVIYLHYSLKKDEKLQEIAQYIQEINNKNYSLNIEDNGEGELAILRNELYKMTVMLKEQAQNSMKDKEALTVWVQDISHQLKTPLTSISIMLDNIRENENMTPEVRHEFITEISKQIEGINFLVLSLLKLSKFDAGVVVLNEDKIFVYKLINDAINNLSILLDIRNVKIQLKTNDEQIYFIGDYKWQLEAITNIIKNCIEHTPENKKIYIEYSKNNFYTKITINDEGKGIDTEDLKHIFERFYKGKNSSEDSIGIGLALSKTIIEKDNGYISVMSKVGEGSIFEIKYMRK